MAAPAGLEPATLCLEVSFAGITRASIRKQKWRRSCCFRYLLRLFSSLLDNTPHRLQTLAFASMALPRVTGTAMALTAIGITRLKPGTDRREIPDGAIPGL